MNLKTKKYTGIIPPIVTPLTEKGELDEGGFKQLIEHLITNGVNGIFTMGTFGEGTTLPNRVWRKVHETALSVVNRRVPLMCGALECSTIKVIEQIKELEHLGAEAAVVTVPYYMRPSCESEILRHYEMICKSTFMDVIIYNIPATTGTNIQPDLLKKLTELDNVKGIKDSSGSMTQLTSTYFMLENSNISLLCGDGNLIALSVLIGADGGVPGLANYFPRLHSDMYEAACRKDITKAMQLQYKAIEIGALCSMGKSWLSSAKYVGAFMGLHKEYVAIPLEPLNDEQRNHISSFLKNLGICSLKSD